MERHRPWLRRAKRAVVLERAVDLGSEGLLILGTSGRPQHEGWIWASVTAPPPRAPVDVIPTDQYPLVGYTDSVAIGATYRYPMSIHCGIGNALGNFDGRYWVFTDARSGLPPTAGVATSPPTGPSPKEKNTSSGWSHAPTKKPSNTAYPPANSSPPTPRPMSNRPAAHSRRHRACLLSISHTAIGAAPCRVQALEPASPRPTDSVRVLEEGTEHELDDRRCNLVGEPVELPHGGPGGREALPS